MNKRDVNWMMRAQRFAAYERAVGELKSILHMMESSEDYERFQGVLAKLDDDVIGEGLLEVL